MTRRANRDRRADQGAASPAAPTRERSARDPIPPAGEERAALPAGEERAALHGALERWYGRVARDLPWRRTRDPYAIWISEAMLQQTRVETVVEYWTRFLESFPTVEALAGASEDQVLTHWSGLGYYQRARSLHAAARAIVEQHGGRFPDELDALRALPGIGPYTAGAVLSIAFDLPAAVVDGNVSRVFARLFGIDAELGSSGATRTFWQLAEALVPTPADPGASAGRWNQALMELGATVCKPRPACEVCPLGERCRARLEGRVDELPRKASKPEPIDVALEIALVCQRGRYLLERRPAGGRMAGLWQFPTREVVPAGHTARLFPEQLPRDAREAPLLELEASSRGPAGRADAQCANDPGHESLPDDLGELRHSITRYRIRARLRRARVAASAELDGRFRWCSPRELEELPRTGMAKKVARRLARLAADLD